MQQLSMSTYYITTDTMALIANFNNPYQSKILEPGKHIFTKQKPIEIIQDSCLIYGSTMDGRRSAIKQMLGTDKKLPVPVDPSKRIYMFPTSAVKDKACVWLSYQHIKQFTVEGNNTLVTFRNGDHLLVNTSRKSFEHLFYRTGNTIIQLDYTNIFTIFNHQEEQPYQCPLLNMQIGESNTIYGPTTMHNMKSRLNNCTQE